MVRESVNSWMMKITRHNMRVSLVKMPIADQNCLRRVRMGVGVEDWEAPGSIDFV